MIGATWTERRKDVKISLRIILFILLSVALIFVPIHVHASGTDALAIGAESSAQTVEGIEQEVNAASGSTETNVTVPVESETAEHPENEDSGNKSIGVQSASNAYFEDVSGVRRETSVDSCSDTFNSQAERNINEESKFAVDDEIDSDSIADESLTIADVSESMDSEIESEKRMEETVVGASIRRDIADGLYVLVPKLNVSRCVSIAGNSKANGANVQLAAKNGGFAQAFYVKRLAGTSRYTFVNYHTGKALEMDADSDSSDHGAVSPNVIQNPLTNAQSQQWVLEDLGNGYLQIRACGKSFVLDVAGANTDAGTNVQAYKANQSDTQMWTLVKAYGKVAAESRLSDANLTKGYYRIAPSDVSGLSVDITSNRKNDGANIRLFKSLNSGAQIFWIAPEGDGTYVISGYNSGKYFDCASAKSGSNVYQAGQRDSSYQRWCIWKDSETGKYVIQNKNGSHVVMTAEGGESGANVGQDSFAAKSGQYWSLKKVYGSSIHVEPKDGIYEIRSGLDGNMCLNVAAGSSLNNANIRLYTANATDAQRFAIVGSGYGVYKVVNVNSMRARRCYLTL